MANQLFQVEAKAFSFPNLEPDVYKDAFGELEGLGYPVTTSPFDLLMVADPRYNEEKQLDSSVWDKMKIAHSATMRAPYPNKEELDELYGRKAISGKLDHSRNTKASQMSLGGRN